MRKFAILSSLALAAMLGAAHAQTTQGQGMEKSQVTGQSHQGGMMHDKKMGKKDKMVEKKKKMMMDKKKTDKM
jgi:hypothetical protein